MLTIDFKSYFANINHNNLKIILKRYLTDERVLRLAYSFIDAFNEKGLGLGSETSQIFAIFYINDIDHYIKDNLGIKAYGRYMDDSYILYPNKQVLKSILNTLIEKYTELGIKINKKKTHIRKLSQGFTFLKTRFYLTDTGKIIKKPCRESITRERRKLKRQAKLYKQGILPLETINQSFESWKGSMKYKNAKRSVYETAKLYNMLFKMKGEKKWKMN